MKVLFVTVGGSHQPIVTSIEKNKPDYVCFLATESTDMQAGSRESVDGDGLVCKDQRTGKAHPSIVAQTGLSPEQYRIYIVDSDNPYKTYMLCVEEITKHLDQKDQVVIDYTGGTKSMSVGLAIAGMEFPQCEISIVTGIRKDLVKVKDGMERLAKLPSNSVFIQRQFNLCENLISQRNYDSANRVLDELSANKYIEIREEFDRLFYLTKAFDEWDKFNYKSAAVYIEMYKNEEIIKPYNSLVQRLKNSVEWFDNWTPEAKNPPGPGFLLVYDLLTNAERKASNQLYDDAISRMYRAVEMYEQFCHMTGNPKLNTSDIDVGLLPNDYVEEYEAKRNKRNNKVQIALEEGYQLLARLNHPIGSVWLKWESKLRNVLKKRNNSFLAHGNQPLTNTDYLEVKNVVWPFINECDQALNFKQGLKDYQQLPIKFY